MNWKKTVEASAVCVAALGAAGVASSVVYLLVESWRLHWSFGALISGLVVFLVGLGLAHLSESMKEDA